MAEETNPVEEAQEELILQTNLSGSVKPVPEPSSDQEPADDSTETESKGGDSLLRQILLRMVENKNDTSSTDDNLDELRRTLADGAEVNAKDTNGGTALHLAARNGLVDAAEKLIDAGAKVFEVDSEGQQPLHKACSGGHVEMVNKLVGKDASTQITDNDGWSPLHLASRHGHTEVIKALLAKDKGNLDDTEKLEGWTALHLAIYNGHAGAVSILLKEAASVSIQDNDRWTPLMTATKQKHKEIMQELFLQNRDIGLETRSNSGHTPLLAASINGFEDGVKLLIGKGADCNVETAKSQSTPLVAASSWGYIGIVEALLETRKIDVNAHDKDMWTALHEASLKGHSKVVELLLGWGADVKKVIENGQTALHLASQGGHENIVKQLLGAQAVVDATDKAGETALHLASGAIPEDDREDDDDELGFDGLSPEERAKEEFRPNRHAAVVGLLLEKGAKPQARTSKGETALHLAAARGDPARLKPILDKMDQEHMLLENNEGRTAFFLASTGDSPDNALKSLLRSDKLRTAEFGKGDGEIEWAAKDRETHHIAQWLMEERLVRGGKIPPTGSGGWSVIKWAVYTQLPTVLLLLITNTPPTPKLKADLKCMALDLAMEAKNGLEDSGPARSQKPQKRRLEKTETRRERSAKEPETNPRLALVDILRDPPFSQRHKDSEIDKPQEPNDTISKILDDHEATIVQFYKGEGESATFRRHRSLKEVIYDHGPGEIMANTISGLKQILGESSELPDSLKHLNTEPKFTWIHLPATNMAWMNDMFLRIIYDETCKGPMYHELKSFFRDSWTQVPDRTSESRSMRPRTVVKLQENKADGRLDNVKKGEEKNSKGDKKMTSEEETDGGGERSGCKDDEAESEQGGQTKNKADFTVASATYMPYFYFSTRDWPDKEKFDDMKKAYKPLDDPTSSVIHCSPTLDEWHYQFAPDEESAKDKQHRNNTQVVSRAVEGNLIRVNQLWAWTFLNKWLITATPCLSNGSNDRLVEGILDQLRKEAEAGGSATQPESAVDMSGFVVDYCIGSYERPLKPEESKTQQQGSIRQIFSNTINKIGRQEAALFEKFRDRKERGRERIPNEPGEASRSSPKHWRKS